MAYLKDNFLLYKLFTGLCTWNNIIMYYFYHVLSSNYKISWLLWQGWSHNYFPPLTFKNFYLFICLFCILVKTSLPSFPPSLFPPTCLCSLSPIYSCFCSEKGRKKDGVQPPLWDHCHIWFTGDTCQLAVSTLDP